MKNGTTARNEGPELSIVLGSKPATATTTLNPDDVAREAYFAWERAGKPEGCSDKFWLEAEAQLRANGSATKATRKNGRARAAA